MSTNKINIEAVNARAREEQTPMSPEKNICPRCESNMKQTLDSKLSGNVPISYVCKCGLRASIYKHKPMTKIPSGEQPLTVTVISASKEEINQFDV